MSESPRTNTGSEEIIRLKLEKKRGGEMRDINGQEGDIESPHNNNNLLAVNRERDNE